MKKIMFAILLLALNAPAFAKLKKNEQLTMALIRLRTVEKVDLNKLFEDLSTKVAKIDYTDNPENTAGQIDFILSDKKITVNFNLTAESITGVLVGKK